MRPGAITILLLLLLCSAKCRLIMSDEHMKSNANDAVCMMERAKRHFPIVQVIQPKKPIYLHYHVGFLQNEGQYRRKKTNVDAPNNRIKKNSPESAHLGFFCVAQPIWRCLSLETNCDCEFSMRNCHFRTIHAQSNSFFFNLLEIHFGCNWY